MDDGFQHRSLNRDVDIVLVDGGMHINDHKLLPQGLLREPWHHIKRADVIIITKKQPEPLLQRRLRIGYNRAARIVEKMEEIGIVGELESNGKREVLAPPPPED